MNKKTVNIAIIGFGNIGSYFYKTLEKNKNKIYLKTGKIVNNLYLNNSPVSPENLGQLIKLISTNEISGKIAKDVLEDMFVQIITHIQLYKIF